MSEHDECKAKNIRYTQCKRFTTSYTKDNLTTYFSNLLDTRVQVYQIMQNSNLETIQEQGGLTC